MVRRFSNSISIFLSLVLLAILVGCGGGGGKGGGGSTTTGVGTARFNVVWPSRSRGIPVTANSLMFSVKAGKSAAATQVVARPADGSPSAVVFTNLPTGIVSYVAQAYLSIDATGEPIGEGGGTVNVDPTAPSEVPVTTGSKVTRLTMSDTNVRLRVQDQATVSVTAYNAEGQVVLLETNSGIEPVAWTSSDTRNITVEGTGPTAILKALTTSPSMIRATLSGTNVYAERPFTASAAVASQNNVVILGTRDPSQATLSGSTMTVSGDAVSSIGVGTVVASSQGVGLLRKVTAVLSPGVYATTTATIEEAFKNTFAAIRTNLDAFSAANVQPGVAGVTVTSGSFGPVALSLSGVSLGNGATINGQMTVSADITHEVIVEDGTLTYTKTEPIFHTYSKTTLSGTAVTPGPAEVLLATVVGKPIELKPGIAVSPTIRVYARYNGGTVQTFGVSATNTFDSHVGVLYQLGRWFAIAGTDHTDDFVPTGAVDPGLDVTYAPCRPVLDVATNGIPFTVTTLDGAAYRATAKGSGLVVDADFFGTFVASAAMFSPTISDYSTSNVVAQPIRGTRAGRLASVTGRSQVKHPPLAPRR